MACMRTVRKMKYHSNDQQVLRRLMITRIKGSTLQLCDKDDNEDLTSPKYLEYKNTLLYPILPLYQDIYNLWLEHQSCFWSVSESNPSDDRHKFVTAPKDLQKIVLNAVACLMIGDSIVLDRIGVNIKDELTPVPVRAMFVDQETREYTHKAMYSKMLDVSPNADYYRSEQFRDRYMSIFEELAKHYECKNVRVHIYFIMLCENILFAPLFQIICYLATTGYAPKLCDANLLVMRDEYIHYKNARLLASKFAHKIDLELARTILFDFKDACQALIVKIIGDYNEPMLNYKIMMGHFNHIVHKFMTENSLYAKAEEFVEHDKLFNVSPAEDYMMLPQTQLKINRMESNSTIYNIDDDTKDLNINFNI
jgi:ribonucleotide reductase beta subunit family protein with ferritin-like domain